MDYKNLLSSLISPSPTGGMAQQAASAMQSRPYMLHVKEAEALGQKPMTPEEFMKAQRS